MSEQKESVAQNGKTEHKTPVENQEEEPEIKQSSAKKQKTAENAESPVKQSSAKKEAPREAE